MVDELGELLHLGWEGEGVNISTDIVSEVGGEFEEDLVDPLADVLLLLNNRFVDSKASD